MAKALKPNRLLAILVAIPILHGVPLFAQTGPTQQDIARAESLEDEYGQGGLEEEIDGIVRTRGRPWTFQLRLPVDWRSNLNLAESNLRSGATIGPDISVSRRWGTGKLRAFTEFGSFSTTVLPDATLDTSGFYGTFELENGRPSEGVTPYVGYEPFKLYRGRFESSIISTHRFSVGVRRAWGPTFVDLHVRREEASIESVQRWGAGTIVSHSLTLSPYSILNLRGEAEFNRHDSIEEERRRDLRTRLRARLIVQLDPAVDLQLTADLRKSWSSAAGFSTTTLVVGPTLVARLGF